MRATARLLQVMQEKLIDVRDFDNADFDFQELVSELVVMLDELRRHGDTLVRGDDLREVVAVANRAIALRAVAPDLTKTPPSTASRAHSAGPSSAHRTAGQLRAPARA